MQYKYIAALIASLSVSSVLAGPVAMPFGDVDHALATRAEAALQAHAAQLAQQAKAGTLTAAEGQTAQARLNAAHNKYSNVRLWLPYCIDDYCCYPGTVSYDFEYAVSYGFCGYW